MDSINENNLHEANLLNNQISYDSIREKSRYGNNGDSGDDAVGGDNDKNVMDEIMKNIANLPPPSEETDMMFQYMANPDKMVPEDKLKLFEKDHHHHHQRQESEFRKPTESINDYVRDSPKRHESYSDTQNSYHHNEPKFSKPYNDNMKASSFGPSYGEGPSLPNLSQDKFEGFQSEEELNLAKLDMLRKLGELVQYGVKLSQNYSMNSPYKAMKYEYELHKNIRDKHNGVKWLSNLMLNICWGAELANDNFNPFEFKLKGWSEQMNEDIPEYYDVLGELYEKYFKSGKPIPPELKLVLMIGGSAVKFHIAHAALGSIPTLSEALLQNPALAKKLNEQTVSTKVKEQFDKQKELFEKASDKQHEMARKKAEDLQMLKEKQNEYTKMNQNDNVSDKFMQQQMMQQQMMQQQLLEKQKQLEELQKQLNLQRSDSRSMYTHNTSPSKMNQKTMAAPVIPESIRGRFKSKMGYEYNNADNIGLGAVYQPEEDNVSIDPHLDDIINNSLHGDDKSKISAESSIKRRGRRKAAIKVET